MTVKEVISESEPLRSLENFCLKRPSAYDKFIRLCGNFNNPKTQNSWVLIATVIQKFGEFSLKINNIEALKDFDVLSDWLVENLERCRTEKIKEGLPVPVR